MNETRAEPHPEKPDVIFVGPSNAKGLLQNVAYWIHIENIHGEMRKIRPNPYKLGISSVVHLIKISPRLGRGLILYFST
ncbi:hypothetical protein [Anaeromassilibacillus sp. SJQ-1]|uniref:hypothetical protein n=1 Tax=Anaeromassilibacillus sp. SJQ-1 TaxID=3375419 RepID=UPI00398A017A